MWNELGMCLLAVHAMGGFFFWRGYVVDAVCEGYKRQRTERQNEYGSHKSICRKKERAECQSIPFQL